METRQPQQETHVMLHEGKLETGEDQFYCPTCGRRLLLQWPPNYKKTVLEPGDEYAMHSAGKGGLQMGSAHITQEPELSADDDRRLSQWTAWLDNLDFSGLTGPAD